MMATKLTPMSVDENPQAPTGVETAPSSAPRSAQPTPEMVALEAAANLLLDKLPATTAATIKEASLIYNRMPLWMTVAGLVAKMYENGDYMNPTIDPSWPRVFVDDPIANVKYKCEWCANEFPPKRYKQRACSQACGAELAKLDVAEWESKRRRPMGAVMP